MQPAPRVILYARFSTENQSVTSVSDQLAKCRDYAARQGWRVVAEYSDEAMSGRRDDRPGFKSLLFAVTGRHCDIVLAVGIDRFSRDQAHLGSFYKECLFAEIELHTISGGRADSVQVGVSSIVSSMTIQRGREDTRRGLQMKVEAGLNPGGRAYGYRVCVDEHGERIKGRLRIIEDEALVIRRIFREYAAGVSPMKIAAQLNAEGIPAPRGNGRGTGGWKQNTINGNRERGSGILNNECYIGMLVYNRLRYLTTPDGNRRVSRLNPKKEWIFKPVPHLRLLDDDLWNAVKARQERMTKAHPKTASTDRNHLSVNRSQRRRDYLLSGLLKCGLCGSSLTLTGGNRNGGKHAYYCSARKEKGRSACVGMKGLPRRQAEEFTLAGLRDGLMQPAAYEQFRKDFVQKMQSNQSASEEQRTLLDKRIRTLERAKANLLAAIKSGAIVEDLAEEYNKVSAELKAVQAQRVEAEPALIDLPEDLPDIYRQHITNLVATLSDESVAGDAGDELREMIDRIVVRHDPVVGHTMELEGKIVELLQAGSAKAKGPAVGGAYAGARSSLELVAGAGFEPAAFRL